MCVKVIFLDIDGVLNPDNNYQREFLAGRKTTDVIRLDLICLGWLKKLVDHTGAKIVLSSSWRCTNDLGKTWSNLTVQLNTVGLGIYDRTPVTCAKSRGEEILSWLTSHKANVTSFVILDDDYDDIDDLYPRLVLCPFLTGFRENEFAKAIQILNKKRY